MKRISILAASMLLAVAAQAQTTFTNPLQTTEINQTGTLGLFDSNTGILTGATLTVNGQAVFNYAATNTAAQAQDAELLSRTRLLWTSSIAGVNGLVSVGNLELSDTSGLVSFLPGVTRSFGPTTDTDSRAFNLNAFLANMQAPGGGTFTIGCRSVSGLSVDGGGGNLSTTQATRAGCGANIVYTSTPRPPTQVPEPTSLALVGLALAAAGFTASRRKA